MQPQYTAQVAAPVEHASPAAPMAGVGVVLSAIFSVVLWWLRTKHEQELRTASEHREEQKEKSGQLTSLEEREWEAHIARVNHLETRVSIHREEQVKNAAEYAAELRHVSGRLGSMESKVDQIHGHLMNGGQGSSGSHLPAQSRPASRRTGGGGE